MLVRHRPVAALGFLAAALLLCSPAKAACPTSIGDLAPGTLAPTGNPPAWVVQGDGVVDIADVITLLRHVVGIQDVQWAAPVTGCASSIPGDVSPGRLDSSTMPPTWIPRHDGQRDIGDVIILLRLSVGLIAIDDGLTWYRDAKPIMDPRCTSCHVAAGIAPFPLVAWEDVEPRAFSLRPALTSRAMPPWPPALTCRGYHGVRALDDDELDTLLGWLDDGARRGDPLDEPTPPPPPTPISFDVTMPIPLPYTPRLDVADDYRCFVVDWPVASQTYITGLRVEPDVAAEVHHVIPYAVGAASRATFDQLDAAEAGPGYTCYGGPGGPATATRWIGAWAPGSLGGAFPEDTGIRMPAGSFLVVQIHYNTDYVAPTPDQSVLRFRTATSVAKTAGVALFPASGFFIPAGDPEYTYAQTTSASSLLLFGGLGTEIGVAPGGSYVVHDVGLHMHQLGTRTRIQVQRNPATCLLDIPAWDFHWQGAYGLTIPETLQGSDQVNLSCTWDNSAANQPVVGGMPLPPVNVQWGEGSRDEMCLGILYVTAP